MPGRVRGWRRAGSRERRPRPRLIGCLLWIIAVIVVLIILSLLFGGFHKGTKTGGAGPLSTATVLASVSSPGKTPDPVPLFSER